MSIEENKGIVKIESIFLQKVGNQIAITNKLLQDNFDYLKWWYDLDQIWKDIFESKLHLSVATNALGKVLKEKQLSDQEEILLKYDEVFEKNNKEMKLEAIDYLIKSKTMALGRKHQFELENLTPLSLFTNMEVIQFINVKLKDIQSLKSLKKIKELKFVNTNVDQREINNFQSEFPNCEISFNDRPDSDLF